MLSHLPKHSLEETYAKYVQWAESCGLSSADFEEVLAAVVEEFEETGKNAWQKRVARGRDGLPRWLQATDLGASERERAMALSRLRGLHEAAEALWIEVLGHEGVEMAREKMEELLKLDSAPAEMLKEIPKPWERELKLDGISGGQWIPGVFEFWSEGKLLAAWGTRRSGIWQR